MSEKVSIQESGKSRNFNGVDVIETETPEGESCFWVPESERELETEYVIKNGVYRPQKYGFSDIHVNVFDLTTDLDGNDWKIDIDDIDMPDISLPDFDIDLSLDIGDIGDMPSIDLKIDGVKLDLPDLSETIDLDAGFDVSLDVGDLDDIGIDISGSDLDGLPIDVNIDLGTLDIETTDLPDEIRIMHVPDKMSYKDGEAIDLEGIVVQAYRGGEVWDDPDGKYIDGYIPVHELMVDPSTANLSDRSPNQLVYYSEPIRCTMTGISGSYIGKIYDYDYSITNASNGIILFGVKKVAAVCKVSDFTGTNYHHLLLHHFIASGDLDPLDYRERSYYDNNFEVVAMNENGEMLYGTTALTRYPESCLLVNIGRLGGGENYSIIEYHNTINDATVDFDTCYRAYYNLDKDGVRRITVSWPRPHDSQLLTASFDITVEENDGAAQSNEESSGGTTISGNYGGSHHSGKF